MNEEKLAIETLKALGAKDTSSPSQIKRGTTCFTLPTGSCISEHKTGYIRRNYLNKNGSIYTCYQLKNHRSIQTVYLKFYHQYLHLQQVS